MKTLRLLVIATVLLSLSAAADARVIVYKGSGKILRGNSTIARTVSTTLFFVIDTATFEGAWVFAQTVAGVKSVFNDGSRSYGLANPLNTASAESAYYSTIQGALTDPDSFNFFSVRMGGKKANVFVGANDPVPSPIAKSMAGSYSYTEGTPKVVDGPFRVNVSVDRTQFSNANNLTVTQAANAIVNEYVTAKGYQNVVPVP